MRSQGVFQERIPRTVYRLRLESREPRALALAEAVLLSAGFKEADLIGSFANGKHFLELFDEEALRLKRMESLFGRLKLPAIKVQPEALAPRDWLTLWKHRWRPAALTRKLDVVPVWRRHKYKPRGGRDFIVMDTLLSFGTGLHETTRMLARFIEEKKGAFRSFFDIGTGTGILSLAALKCGADDVWAIDIGDLSIQAARDNMKANQLFFHLQKADIKTFGHKRIFDFVAANLITEDLIEQAHKILKFVKKGGLLAVSGISLDNLGRLRRSYSSLPLKLLKISREKQWTGLLYQRKML